RCSIYRYVLYGPETKRGSKTKWTGTNCTKPRGEAIKNSFLKYTSLATQMALAIGLGVWIGMKLDTYYKLERPYLTMVFSLLGVAVGMYQFMKDFLKKK
ncbi:MAG: AtpZ/AtpI family protein, partial [Bacteroidota bacterium]